MARPANHAANPGKGHCAIPATMEIPGIVNEPLWAIVTSLVRSVNG